MDLKINDVAELLNVPTETIRHWISEGKIPHYQIKGEFLISRSELQDWMISHKLDHTGSASPFSSRTAGEDDVGSPTRMKGGSQQFGLFRAIHKGDVLHNVGGTTKEEAIRTTMRQTAKHLNVDADVISELLLDRERLMPTALSNGIAVPHTRDTLLSNHQDAVVVAFLKHPLEYGALDGKSVHTLFFLFACEDKRHLHLLAKIAHLSNQSEALELFKRQPSKEQLLSYVKEWENRMTPPGQG